jgi:hypothetical protein
MTTSAIILGAIGIILTFIPQEVSRYLNLTESTPILFQILGALYFGFAVMNWMAKTVLIGGIFARPLTMGNFAHFMIATIALIKGAMNNSISHYYWILAILYLIFAVLFGIVVFTNPTKK